MAVLIIIIVLIVFGFIFYAKYVEGKIKGATSTAREDEAYAVIGLAANLPELHCSENNVMEENCYDILKIKHMQAMLSDSTNIYLYYQGIFKNTKLTIYEIYPGFAPTNDGWMAEADDAKKNYTDPVYYVVYDSEPENVVQKIPARIPVKLYNPLTEETKLGIIEVIKYY